MKIAKSVLAICIMLLSCETRDSISFRWTNGLKRENIHGNVKSVDQYQYRFLDPKTLEKELVSHTKITYDEIGNPTEEKISYGQTSEVERTNVYLYDVYGKLLQMKKRDASGNEFEFTNFKIDYKGDIVHSTTHGLNQNNSGISEEVVNTFDAYGKLVTSEDVRFGKMTYYTCDATGIIKESLEKSILTKTIIVDGIETKRYEPLTRKVLYSYDHSGNVTETIRIDQNGEESKSSFQYEYDENKNWLKRTFFIQRRAIALDERTITYY